MTPRNPDALALYLHIPFCHARCGYCDFVTFTGQDDQRGRYAAAVAQEITLYQDVLRRPLGTVFFGGGTPSALDVGHFQTIFNAIRQYATLQPDIEITVEANPESITPEKLAGWRDLGINRLSLGLQVYDDDLLKAMGRLHTVAQFETAYGAARRAGFANINIDLIYGFPGQDLAGWNRTLEQTAALNPEHLSLYALAVEEHTPFAAQGAKVDADLQAAMYAAARGALASLGYGQYEISNFARPGFECRHNLTYWRAQDYLGVGVGAVGCVGGVRWENQKNFGPYFKDLASRRLPRQKEEQLSEETQRFERLMLGLRLREGFPWVESDARWLAERSRLAAQGWLEQIKPDVWRIPDSYVAMTNQVLLPFLPS
jgi:oxygen-independent coproporphyrinogen-3 oxidase